MNPIIKEIISYFDELRDAYLSLSLATNGIKVVRVDLKTVRLDEARKLFQDIYL